MKPLLRWGLLGCLAALLAGCLRHESPVALGNKEQILHRGIGHDLADLDPALGTLASDYSVLSSLFEGLVAEDPVDLHPVPGVAERWDCTPDGIIWTFHLRHDARWSNGEPVTAQDFVDSWKRALTPALAADGAAALYVIQGAEAFNHGAQAPEQLGLQAIDPSTLKVTLERPVPDFLSRLNQAIFFPVPLATIARYGKPDDRSNPWAKPGRLVGNGPFTLEEWTGGQEIVVARSKTYWDRAHVRLTAIHFHAIDDLDTEERAFRADQLHLTEAIPVDKIDSYRRDQPNLLRIDPLSGVYFYRLNVRTTALSDPRVRRALSLAIDREAIVSRILRGGQLAAYTFTPPNTAGFTAQSNLTGGVEEARKLLAQAGFPDGANFPTLELSFNSSETHKVIAEAIQEMWKRNLGIQVSLVQSEIKGMLEARRSGTYQILRGSWTADYADPEDFLSVWTSTSGNNYTGWGDSDYDATLFEAGRTSDETRRLALYQRAETLLLSGSPIIPIYFYTHDFLIKPSVKGWYPTVLDHHPYKAVYLEPTPGS